MLFRGILFMFRKAGNFILHFTRSAPHRASPLRPQRKSKAERRQRRSSSSLHQLETHGLMRSPKDSDDSRESPRGKQRGQEKLTRSTFFRALFVDSWQLQVLL